MNVITTITSFVVAIRTVRGGIVTLLWHLARQINKLVTAAIARWERQATIATLQRLGDRELKDIGLRRSGIGAALVEAARTRTRRTRTG